MFKEVQQLKIEQLEQELDQLYLEHAAIYQKLNNLNGKIRELKYFEKKGINGYEGKKQFSFFERLITARKAYQAYRTKLSELQNLSSKIARLEHQIIIVEKQTEEKIVYTGILDRIEKTQNDIVTAKKATTLVELGIEPLEAMRMLQANDITPVWGEGDYESFHQSYEEQDEIKLFQDLYQFDATQINHQASANGKLSKLNLGNNEKDFTNQKN